LTSDYLKQLQLTKQLEAKARQATKERKTAESRLVETGKEIRAAREEGYDVCDLEKLHAQAVEAFSKRNNDLVLSFCESSRAALLELKKERVCSIADETYSILSPLSEEVDKEISGMLDQAASLANEGRADEALALAADAKDKAEKQAAEQLAELMERTNELLALADSLNLKVKGARKPLAEAMKLNGGEKAWELLGESISLVFDAFSAHFDQRRKKIEEAAAEAEQAGLQLAELKTMMDSAASSLREGDMEASLKALDDAGERLPDIISRAAAARSAELRADAVTVSELGGDVSAFDEGVGEGR